MSLNPNANVIIIWFNVIQCNFMSILYGNFQRERFLIENHLHKRITLNSHCTYSFPSHYLWLRFLFRCRPAELPGGCCSSASRYCFWASFSTPKVLLHSLIPVVDSRIIISLETVIVCTFGESGLSMTHY